MEQKEANNTPSEEPETLDKDGDEIIVADSSDQTPQDPAGESKQPVAAAKVKSKSPLSKFFARFNIYLLLFALLLLIAGVVAFVSYQKDKANFAKKENINNQPLSDEVLEQLRQTDVTVGDPKQILSVESNAIFAGQVLIKGNLEVAGQIKSGVPVSLSSLNVSGTTTFGKIQGGELQITGNSTIQGQLNVQKGLTVAGSASVSGLLSAAQLNIQNLEVSGDLKINRHIDAGGGTPGRSNGSALGAGGTSSISGTDTAGTVAINTGGGPPAGCLVNVTFNQRYNGTPHVVVSPVGSAGGGLGYYVNRSNTGFSICTVTAPPAGQSFAFDYIVID